QTFIQLLDKNFDDRDMVKKYLEKIGSSAQRMAKLIRGVLDYSRLNDYEEKQLETDLNLILEQVKTDFELVIKEKGAVIISNPLPVVKGMPLQLNQLFSNFISNSLKFAVGRPEIRISSRLVSGREIMPLSGVQRPDPYYEIVFEDNGIGFDPKFGDQIFTMFRRLHGHQDFPGTGIGLALCKKIAENHKGFIQAEGNPDKGASFRVYLPV
ncbi:MAG TPA: ATP-binding protein, partial [Puia sp.]